MSRTAHRDNELKPPTKVVAALGRWLSANGLKRVALVEPLGTRQSRVTRLFAGEAYLSATQRRAIDEFTGGAITVAMLEGKAPPPAKVKAKRSTPLDSAAEKLAAEILAWLRPAIVDVLREELRREARAQVSEGGTR